jgi:hypothetical protein
MNSATRIEGLPTTQVSDGEIITTPDGTTHYLNGMATLIYELADGRASASIALSVATIFDLSTDDAATLVEQSLAEMRAKGLVN